MSTDFKQLRAWLQWATNEDRPSAEERAARASELPDVEYTCLSDAAYQMLERAQPGADAKSSEEDIGWCLSHHPVAFRELTLAFAAAVERMREVVPEADSTLTITVEERDARGKVTAARVVTPAVDEVSIYEMYQEMVRQNAWLIADTVGISPLHLGSVSTSGQPTSWPSKSVAPHELRCGICADLHFAPTETCKFCGRTGKPMPQATPGADGTNVRDAVCQCGEYIVERGSCWLDARTEHSAESCDPIAPQSDGGCASFNGGQG